MQTASDQELVRTFAERHSETAFAEVVRRHVDLVHSVALRITGEPHLAQDVTQCAFLALANQSASVARRLAGGIPLSGWLHRTTRNLAAKAVRDRTRRRVREQEAARMGEYHSMPEGPREDRWSALAPHLDRTLAQLADADRHVVLLRFFERRTAGEIGARLGISEKAAQKRVRRALERLRLRLATVVPGLSGTTLATLLGLHAVKSAPASLAGTIVTALSPCLPTASSGLVATRLADLLSTAVMTKSQVAILSAAIVVLAIPISLQQLKLRHLHRELEALPPPAVAEFVTSAPAIALASSPTASEADAIAHLQQRAAELRALLAAKHTRPVPSMPPRPPSPRATGPVLLTPGRKVPLTELVYAGDDSVEATVQSLQVLQRDGDLLGAWRLMLPPPSKEAEMHEMISSPDKQEAREQLREHTIAEMAAVQAVELESVRSVDDRRCVVTLKVYRSDETDSQQQNFGLTDAGWRLLP